MTATPTPATVLSHLRRWLSRSHPDSTPDGALLRQFVHDRDESAFAALVDRHGPMVLGVARRVVGDHHLAEDIFQATFLTLARRAGQIRRPAALPAWLHRSACNIAVTALRARKRRERVEAEAIHRVPESPLDDLSSRELLTILDEELRRLPEAFRLPLVLCCLEGRSQDEAATLLGWTLGSVKGRLERGRQRLKDRLIRRGLTFAIGAGVPLLVVRPTLAGLLRQATIRAACQGGAVSPVVSALANAVVRPLLVVGWKTILVVATLGLVGSGLGIAWLLSSRGQTAGQTALPPVAADQDKSPSPRTDHHGDPLPEGAVGRLGSSRLRIGNAAFALTADGRVIVTVAPEGVVRRFDANTGQLLERQQLTDRSDVDSSGQFQAQLSADGKTAAIDEVSTGGQRVTVWDVPAGKMIFRCAPAAGSSIGAYALSPDGKQLGVYEYGANSQTLSVYELNTGRKRLLGNVEYNVYGIRFTSDGKRAFVSQTSAKTSGGSTFACFDIAAGKELWRLPRKGQEFAVSPDGKTLVSATFNGEFQIIETEPDSGKPSERMVPYRQAHPNVRMVIAPDNHTVVMRHFDAFLTWDLLTGKEVRRLALPKTSGRGYGPELGALSPDSRTVITNLGYLQRWDLVTGKPFFDVPPDDGLGGPIERLAFTTNGKELFASSWSLNSACWDVTTGKQLSYTQDRSVYQLIPTPAGLRAVRTDAYMTPTEFVLFDPIAGKSLQTIHWGGTKEVGINAFRACALTASGKTVLVAYGEEPGVAKNSYVAAYDAASGRRLARFAVPGNFYYPRSPFSLCGRWAVLGGKVYHVATGTAVFTPTAEPGERLYPGERMAGPVWFSEDGRLLVGKLLRKEGEKSVVTDTLAVWELASGKVLARFPNATFVSQVALAPGGRTIALLDGWGIRICDLLTGRRIAAYSAPDVACRDTDRGCFTQTLVFAPDGRTLATGHQDGTVLLWKVPQPAEESPMALAEGERESLWADLGSESPAKARRAVERLAHNPAAATALLTARFRPVPTPPESGMAALIKDLNSNTFATREQANQKLREYGSKAEPALRRALAGTPSPEMRRRVEGILGGISAASQMIPLSADTLRGVRAIEVLERTGTKEARMLLDAWAAQERDVRLAAEAKAAVERSGPVTAR